LQALSIGSCGEKRKTVSSTTEHTVSTTEEIPRQRGVPLNQNTPQWREVYVGTSNIEWRPRFRQSVEVSVNLIPMGDAPIGIQVEEGDLISVMDTNTESPTPERFTAFIPMKSFFG